MFFLVSFFFTKYVPLRVLTDRNCLEDSVPMYFCRNEIVVLELKTINQLVLKRLDYVIPVYLSYARPKYLVGINLNYSLRFSALIGVRHVAIILSNTIFCHF